MSHELEKPDRKRRRWPSSVPYVILTPLVYMGAYYATFNYGFPDPVYMIGDAQLPDCFQTFFAPADWVEHQLGLGPYRPRAITAPPHDAPPPPGPVRPHYLRRGSSTLLPSTLLSNELRRRAAVDSTTDRSAATRGIPGCPMRDSTPNRNGWISGPLADAPACPPFPAFTDFERRALDSAARLFDEEADAFREQIAAAEVVDRINTIVGFYTRVKVDRARCSPVPLRHRRAHFEVEGIESGIGILLWDKDGDGYLETIEGWTVGDNPLADVDLANLKFLRPVKIG